MPPHCLPPGTLAVPPLSAAAASSLLAATPPAAAADPAAGGDAAAARRLDLAARVFDAWTEGGKETAALAER